MYGYSEWRRGLKWMTENENEALHLTSCSCFWEICYRREQVRRCEISRLHSQSFKWNYLNCQWCSKYDRFIGMNIILEKENEKMKKWRKSYNFFLGKLNLVFASKKDTGNFIIFWILRIRLCHQFSHIEREQEITIWERELNERKRERGRERERPNTCLCMTDWENNGVM